MVYSFMRNVCWCIGAVFVAIALTPGGALADTSSRNLDNQQGLLVTEPAEQVQELVDETGTEGALVESSAVQSQWAPDPLPTLGVSAVSALQSPDSHEASVASETPAVPQAAPVTSKPPDTLVVSSAWTASVELSTYDAPAGTEVVVVPRVSGADQADFTYNYVWERDGWTDWSSTIKETGVSTAAETFSFYPTRPGLYTVMVDITDANGRMVNVSSSTLQVTSPTWTASAKADRTSAQVGETVTVDVSPSSSESSSFAYNYVWERDGWQDWDSTLRATDSYSPSSSWSFAPTVAGTYNLFVDVIDSHGVMVTVNAGVVKVAEPAWNLSLSLSQGAVQTGQESVLTPTISGIDATGFTYNYVWNYEGVWREWGSTISSTGSTTSESSYAFKAAKAGTYELYVDAISPSGTRHTGTVKIKVNEPSWQASAVLNAGTVKLGDSVIVTPEVDGAQSGQTFTYNYVWSYNNWSSWDSTVKRTGLFTAEGAYSFTPAKSGAYMIAIDVRDQYGAVRTVRAEFNVVHDFTYSGVKSSADLLRAGDSVTITPQVQGDTSGLTYNYVWMKDNWAKWGSTVQNGGAATTDAAWTFTPPEPGNYTVFVDVIGSDGVAETLSCELAVWELLGVEAHASGYTWTVSADLGISNAANFGFTYNYVYNQGNAWKNWSSTLRETGIMTTATSASYNLSNGGTYGLYVDVVSPSGEKATASKTVVTYVGDELDMWSRINGLLSPTNYLLACDTDACVVGVYEKQGGNWVQIKRWSCTTGAWNTPTRKGLYAIESKGTSFDSYGVRCYWYSGYSGPYLFHSICYWPNGAVQDGRLGMHLSHGCIRLDIANAKWIYDTVPYGTTVYVY